VLLLAIDTSTRRVGVAFGSEQGLVAAVTLGGPADPGPPRHAERLAPAIEYAKAEAGIDLGHVSAVTVSVGPGMFTGLRVGVTTAKVMAHALRVPVIPIPSLDLLAYPLRHTRALVVPAIDARRNELYFAIYRSVPGGLQRESGYDLGTPSDLSGELEARAEEALLCGDGAIRFRDAFAGLERVEHAGPGHVAPDLAALVELAAARYEREEFVAPSEVVPMYLRQSDAEIGWQRREAGAAW
jgi:tRNA threonylcarbamoyladenosine biosynthesis protein TsaB